MANDAEWDFANGSTLQLVDDADRAGYSSITLSPDDLDAEVERLAQHGLRPSETGTGIFKIAIFQDLAGNQIVLAQKA